MRTTPALVSATVPFTVVVTGSYRSCGQTANGQVYCWNNGTLGPPGVGDSQSHLTPALVRP
jgi:hypothetical protein